MRRRALWLAVLLTGVAFSLRLRGLTASSLWYDETFMLMHLRDGVWAGLWGLLRDDNSLPLYGWSLGVWTSLAGDGEFAARYLSVLLGTVAAPLLMRLSRELVGRDGGGVGLAYATLPIFVYYSQEVRMYALAVPLAAGFAWVGLRLWRTGRGARGYVVLGVALLLAHLYAGLMWLALLAWGLGMSLRPGVRASSKWRMWWRANVWLAASLLPVALWAIWRARMDATATSAIPASALHWLPLTFGVGQYLAFPWAEGFAGIAVLAWGMGAVALWRRNFSGGWWLLVLLVLPVVLLYATTLVKAKWSERYLLPSFGLALVLGVGLGWEVSLRRFKVLGWSLLGAWLALTAPALARQASGMWAVGIRDEWHPRPDFRGVAQYIAAHDRADDVAVVVGGHAAQTLAYYYRGPARIVGLPPHTSVVDTSHPLDLHALTTLERETADAQRVWLVLWQANLVDPTGLVENTLVESCHRLPVTRTFTNVGLLLFDVRSCHPLDQAAHPPHPLVVDFATPIRLLGYDERFVGETWEVDLWWQARGPLPDIYRVYVHLLGPDGSLVTQHDHIAGADAYPTDHWAVGTELRDRFFLHVPGGKCEGCRLRIGLYTDEGRLRTKDGADGVPLPLLQEKEPTP